MQLRRLAATQLLAADTAGDPAIWGKGWHCPRLFGAVSGWLSCLSAALALYVMSTQIQSEPWSLPWVIW